MQQNIKLVDYMFLGELEDVHAEPQIRSSNLRATVTNTKGGESLCLGKIITASSHCITIGGVSSPDTMELEQGNS